MQPAVVQLTILVEESIASVIRVQNISAIRVCGVCAMDYELLIVLM